MQIRNIRTVAGPNVYSRHPVLIMKLDLGPLAGVDSCDVPGFVERLLERLPGLQESEQASKRTLCVFDVKLHVLSHGNCFDMATRRPALKRSVVAR